MEVDLEGRSDIGRKQEEHMIAAAPLLHSEADESCSFQRRSFAGPQ